eukprot:1339064-Rhodomonas_salina.1
MCSHPGSAAQARGAQGGGMGGAVPSASVLTLSTRALSFASWRMPSYMAWNLRHVELSGILCSTTT